MGIEVSGVAMIVAGLFEVDAVGLYVTIEFGEQYLATGFAPAFRFLKLRKHHAEIKETERLSRQVRVGTEIS